MCGETGSAGKLIEWVRASGFKGLTSVCFLNKKKHKKQQDRKTDDLRVLNVQKYTLFMTNEQSNIMNMCETFTKRRK